MKPVANLHAKTRIPNFTQIILSEIDVYYESSCITAASVLDEPLRPSLPAYDTSMTLFCDMFYV